MTDLEDDEPQVSDSDAASIDAPPATIEGASDDVSEVRFAELASRMQESALPIPTLNPSTLPFHLLDPEVFERVVAEIVFRQGNHLGVHFYGRRGQKQYGLDILERMASGDKSLYQVKRYQVIGPAEIQHAIQDYAGDPREPGIVLPARRFSPNRFVVVTSAEIDRDTANVDVIAALQDEYHGDLDIEVWGAEALSRTMRDASGLVTAIFGRAWAEAFCGSAPPGRTTNDPRPLGLIEEPLEVLGLTSIVADAESCESVDPARSATLLMAVANELDRAAFPGHAALVRGRQATAARAAGDFETAFNIRFEIALARVSQGEELRLSPDSEMKGEANEVGKVALAKVRVLEAVGSWHEIGVNVASATADVLEVVASGDESASRLCCLVLEETLVDGLFDFSEPHSIFSDVDARTPTHLSLLIEAAKDLTSSDVVLRARLRCAIADAELRVNSTLEDVERVYGSVIEDALAGRLLHAGGLVASRAAYAFASHGAVERAENLWRRSTLASSEARLYGDARNSLRALQSALIDNGDWPTLDLQTVVQAMPNRRKLIEASHDVSLNALEAAQENRFPDAFGAARRWLWEARLSGHLAEERLAWRLLGRILAVASEGAAAVECLIRAGRGSDAASVAGQLPALTGTWRWRETPVRRVRAGSIQVMGAQTRLISDQDITRIVSELIELADGLWSTNFVNPNPQLDAIKALAALGSRIPHSAIDQIIFLSGPALTTATAISHDMANLLVQAYWAVEERRDDLALAIGEMLRQTNPPYNLWGLIESMPTAGQDPLIPILAELAERGRSEAVDALAQWRRDAAGVQLAARRACASLLRRPVGLDRDSYGLGNQEERVVALLLGLLDAKDELSFRPEQLTPDLCPTVGAFMMTRGVAVDPPASIDDPSSLPSAEQPMSRSALQEGSDHVDEPARHAAGPRNHLLALVADKLLDLAEDAKDMAGSRGFAIQALRRLLPRLSKENAASSAYRLMNIYASPNLTEMDLRELGSNTPLSRSRIDTGAGVLACAALVAAAEARNRAVEQGHDLTVDADFTSGLISATLPLIRGGGKEATYGATALAAVAISSPQLGHQATGLLFHPSSEVRRLGARYAPMDEHLFLQVVLDPESEVRAATAARGKELPQSVQALLAVDRDSRVRSILESALNSTKA